MQQIRHKSPNSEGFTRGIPYAICLCLLNYKKRSRLLHPQHLKSEKTTTCFFTSAGVWLTLRYLLWDNQTYPERRLLISAQFVMLLHTNIKKYTCVFLKILPINVIKQNREDRKVDTVTFFVISGKQTHNILS